MTEQHPNLTTDPKLFRRSQRESLLMEATALAQGFDTMRIGARGFTAGSAPHCGDMAFQDTISLETSRSAVRTADDRLMTKIALTQAKLPVPQSRSFGYKNIDEAVKYAQRFRRGVIVKPRMVESGRVSRKALTGPEQVREAIESWREITGTHATYLVERRIFHREYSFVIVNGEVISVGRCRKQRWDHEMTHVHPDVLALAVQAFKAFPAMPHGEVRMFCPDPTAGADGCIVISVSPEIQLISIHKSEDWSIGAADRLIGQAAQRFKTKPSKSGALITAEFTMNELSDPQDMTEAVRLFMIEAGMEGSVTSGERHVSGTIAGTPGQLVTLSGLAKTGKLTAEAPQTIMFKQMESSL